MDLVDVIGWMVIVASILWIHLEIVSMITSNNTDRIIAEINKKKEDE